MANVKPNTPYWGVITRHPDYPIVHGSHHGVLVDVMEPSTGGRVFTTKAKAEAHLASIPKTYTNGETIPWEVAQIFTMGNREYWYDWDKNAS